MCVLCFVGVILLCVFGYEAGSVSNVLKVCDVRVDVLPEVMWLQVFSSLCLYNDAQTNIYQIHIG